MCVVCRKGIHRLKVYMFAYTNLNLGQFYRWGEKAKSGVGMSSACQRAQLSLGSDASTEKNLLLCFKYTSPSLHYAGESCKHGLFKVSDKEDL